MDLTARLDAVEEKFLPLPGLRFLDLQAHSLVATPTELSRFVRSQKLERCIV